jgi:hypothetical protein
MNKKPSATVEAMRQHIIDLCDANDIWLHWFAHGDKDAYAIREVDSEADGHAANEIVVPPIKSPLSYATALHEIGHILGRNQNSRHQKTRERWAWQWARENALNWTPAMERYATGYLTNAPGN